MDKDKDIVFDTCMQIRHNYDGCKKGMRPSGGRCVPAKGRLNQEAGGGKGVNKFAVGAGLVGAGAAAGLTAGIVGGAIDRHRKLNERQSTIKKPLPRGKERKQITGSKDFIEGDYTVVNEPLVAPGGKERKILSSGKKDSAAQLCFDALSFILSDRSDVETRTDGCKKGMRPKGGRCVPAKGRLKQEGGGGSSNNSGLGGLVATGLAVGGIVGANVYGATRHGQRTIGKAEEWAGNQAARFGKDFNRGMDESAEKTRQGEKYKNASPEAQKRYEENVSKSKGFGNTVRKIGIYNRRFGKKRQAQNEVIV